MHAVLIPSQIPASTAVWLAARGDKAVGKGNIYYMAIERDDIEYRRNVVEEYKKDVEQLVRYLPWLEEKTGTNVSETYTGSGIKGSSIPFPVYDGTLMGFVKTAQRTKLLDRNYPYLYSKHGIRTPQDELRMIASADIIHMDVLKGILSRYIMGGMTKGGLWTEAVQNGVFLNIVKKMKENLEFWDKPIQQ